MNRFRGAHRCEFCPKPAVIADKGRFKIVAPDAERQGNGEIRVAGPGNVTYVAPVLIRHYVTEHDYQPPKEFVDAVMATP
ncbi:MAG: hypothetical protein AAF351_00315 [Pseudomonadota bacterium]